MPDITEKQMNDIKEIICDVLELEPEELSDDDSFVHDHGADSLRAIEILASLERQLGVTLEQEDLSRMISLKDVYKVVAEAAARV